MTILKLKQSCASLALVAAACLSTTTAIAGPLDEAKARAHLDAVAPAAQGARK
jgi:hypothetical protein